LTATIGDDELRRVRHEDPYPVAFLHAQLHQCSRHVIGESVHLLVRNDRALEDSAGAVGIFSRRFFQKIK
jgi:hypothetical protein